MRAARARRVRKRVVTGADVLDPKLASNMMSLAGGDGKGRYETIAPGRDEILVPDAPWSQPDQGKPRTGLSRAAPDSRGPVPEIHCMHSCITARRHLWFWPTDVNDAE